MGRYIGVLTIYDVYDKVQVASLKDIAIEDECLTDGELERIDEFICESVERHTEESGYAED